MSGASVLAALRRARAVADAELLHPTDEGAERMLRREAVRRLGIGLREASEMDVHELLVHVLEARLDEASGEELEQARREAAARVLETANPELAQELEAENLAAAARADGDERERAASGKSVEEWLRARMRASRKAPAMPRPRSGTVTFAEEKNDGNDL